MLENGSPPVEVDAFFPQPMTLVLDGTASVASNASFWPSITNDAIEEPSLNGRAGLSARALPPHVWQLRVEPSHEHPKGEPRLSGSSSAPEMSLRAGFEVEARLA
jgi:hypothetical protein